MRRALAERRYRAAAPSRQGAVDAVGGRRPRPRSRAPPAATNPRRSSPRAWSARCSPSFKRACSRRTQSPPEERPTIELFGSLMSLIALPYLGAGAARRELTRPAPAPARRARRHGRRARSLRGPRRTAHLPHRPRPAGDRSLPGRQQPRGRRTRRHRRPGPDLQAPVALGDHRRDRQPQRRHLARRTQRLAPDRARRARRARGAGALRSRVSRP